MKKFVALTSKMYRYLTENESVNKKAKDTKKSIMKREIKLEDDTKCTENNKRILKLQQKFN